MEQQKSNAAPANAGRRELIKKAAYVVPVAMAAVALSERPAYAQSGGAGGAE